MKKTGKADNWIRTIFLELLDSCKNEQVYQKFIEDNTKLVPREFIQNHGLHFDLVLRKLRLADDYISDFFYLSKSSIDWNCVLIEIEKPQSRYFEEGRLDFHNDFQIGLKQISRWRAWFDDQNNFNRFINGTIGNLRVPLGMTSNKCFIKYILVTGRRSEIEGNPQRRNLIRTQERKDFKIISFDSLCEGLHSKNELYLGVRKNEYFEIITKKFISENIFCWMEPEQLRINEELRKNIIANKDQWSMLSMDINRPMLEDKLPKLLNVQQQL